MIVPTEALVAQARRIGVPDEFIVAHLHFISVAWNHAQLIGKIFMPGRFLYGVVAQADVGTNRFENQPALDEAVHIRLFFGRSRTRE